MARYPLIDYGAYFLKTLMFYTLAFFCIVFIAYAAMYALPGDPLLLLFADFNLAENSPAYQRLQAMYGYQHGMLEGFIYYCTHLLQGDFGFSTSYSTSVITVIGEVLPWTWLLTLASAPPAMLLAYLVGLEAAMRHGKLFDITALVANNIIHAMPSFVKAVLIFFVFLYWLPQLPLQGAETPLSDYTGWQRVADIALHLIAPSCVLLLVKASMLLLPIRAASLAVLAKPYLGNAKLRGLSGWRLRHAYIGGNIKGVLIVRGAMMLVSLLGGSIFVETVFSYPGMGLALFNGINGRDFALVQGIILVLALHILLLHFIADIAIHFIGERG